MQAGIPSSLPKLTNKQREIIQLLYVFRFLDRIQIQALLHHKDYKRINVWLKYLRENNYVGWIYSTDFANKTKPAVYYLGLNGIRYLRTLASSNGNGTQIKDYPVEELRKRYREAERSQTYIDRCLLVADCVLALERAQTDVEWFYYETEAEYFMGGFYHFLTESGFAHPQLCFAKMNGTDDSSEPVTAKNYLLEIFDLTLPRYRMRKRLDNYVKFFREGIWEADTDEDEPVPTILCLCASLPDLIYAKRKVRSLLANEWSTEDEDRPHMKFTTVDRLKDKGLLAEIWEEA